MRMRISLGQSAKRAMQAGVLAVVALIGVAGPSASGEAKGTFTTFAVAGSTETYVYGINGEGAVTGSFADNNNLVYHGFVRTADGAITSFDPSGSVQTVPTSVNSKGTIAGYYADGGGAYHGFLRAASGAIIEFDPPHSSSTEVTSVNNTGVAVGYFFDGNEKPVRGFVRAADGTITPFHVGSVGTLPLCINNKGVVTGTYLKDTFRGHFYHGFVRATDGTISTFEAPGSQGLTFGVSINDNGVIAGFYGTTPQHGFVRAVDGTVSEFDPSGSTNTNPTSINEQGIITGSYQPDGTHSSDGFRRAVDGTITTFHPRSSGAEPSVEAMSINRTGTIAGWYETNDKVRGYILNR